MKYPLLLLTALLLAPLAALHAPRGAVCGCACHTRKA